MVTITVGLPGRCSQPVALQESTVQGLPSSQPAAVWMQAPVASQLSEVHGLPSSQLWAVWVQPVAVQASVVHGSPSSQVGGPLWQTPVAGLHDSAVQAFPSSQFIGVPTHRGPEPVTVQRSLVVHALPSSQGRVSGAPGTQIPELQWSNMVQGFPSSHEAVL
jgi:hypothetical protein